MIELVFLGEISLSCDLVNRRTRLTIPVSEFVLLDKVFILSPNSIYRNNSYTLTARW